jgi:ATP-binding cassette subfamily B protein
MPNTPTSSIPTGKPPKGPNIFAILQPYLWAVLGLAGLTVSGNALTLWMPKIISKAINAYAQRTLHLSDVGWELGFLGLAIFILVYAQNIVQVMVSEKVAQDLRTKVAGKISRQNFTYIQTVTSGRLLTNLTSDIDAIKGFVAQGVSSLISSVALILGASTLLLLTDWKLGLAVLMVIPLIGGFFFYSLQKVRALFLTSRTIIDRLNRVINESILGAALVRVLHIQVHEQAKFDAANVESRNIGLQIVRIFSGLIPFIGFVANLATLVIVGLGGYFVIHGQLSLGDFAAFSSYVGILIFPIIILGFISNMIAQASASYGRVMEVLLASESRETGTITEPLKGAIEVQKVSMTYGEKHVLKDVNFKVSPGSRTAIIGPTAAGKTQLLYSIMGLLEPTSGTILFDGHQIADYNQESLHQHISIVFQDSSTFNISLRENIAFTTKVSEEDLRKAIATAELTSFIDSLPEGLDTVVSERGSSLSGGQKQRLMLARALALNPTILLLDDFTARVDSATEAKILHNLRQNYPNITLLSVTQKISSIEHYDQVLLLMEGELLAVGTHEELLKSSPEYMQIYATQQSTNTYELHPE